MADNPLAGLKASLRGQLITRDDEAAFTAARFRGWNRDLNVRANPLGFAVVSGVRDIVTTVDYCRSNNIPIAVRGKGTHSPYGMANDAIVIDLLRMTAVRVDPEKKLAREIWSHRAEPDIHSPFCSSVYEDRPRNLLLDYALAGSSRSTEIVGLTARGEVAFHYSYPFQGVFCSVAWNAIPVHLEDLVFD